MANPSDKHPDINDLLKAGGFDRVGAIKSDTCTLCKGPATTFKDKLSKSEYSISGMCQPCQDKYFNMGEEDDGNG